MYFIEKPMKFVFDRWLDNKPVGYELVFTLPGLVTKRNMK